MYEDIQRKFSLQLLLSFLYCCLRGEFLTCFFVFLCFGNWTVVSLNSNDGSVALVIASIWTGLVHLSLGVLGTFVLKRFPTSFSVGFLLGVLVVLANQNLIMFATFSSYIQGSSRSNHVFASLGFTLFAVLTFMALLLFHFKQDVVVAPADGKDDEEDNVETARQD